MGYIVSVLVCIVMKSQLIFNANRAGPYPSQRFVHRLMFYLGFLALAQLPVVFLFGTKNSVASLLLGPGRGYEKLNYLHKWAGRGLFLGAVVHGSLWINDHLKYDRPILGEQKETSGVAALGVLCVIVLSSLRVVRRWLYQSFFVIQYVQPSRPPERILSQSPQCPRLRLLLHHDLLPHALRQPVDLPSPGRLWFRPHAPPPPFPD